jgi:hypothetical protein
MDFKKHTEKRICLSNGTPENGGFSPKKGANPHVRIHPFKNKYLHMMMV